MDKAIFRESDHTYWLGNKQLISVTQLLKKHGLSSDYGDVDADVLRAKSARGTQIHKEIEEYIKNGEVGFSRELVDFIDIVEKRGLCEMQSEVIVNNDLVAGTFDLLAKTREGKTILVDNKTTAGADKRAWAWQLSLYEYLRGEPVDELYIFHFSSKKNDEVAIERIAPEEIAQLLECERNGEIYQEPRLAVSTDLLVAAQQAELALKQAEAEKNAAEKIAKEYRQALYEAMGAQNISSWETLDKSMLITRIEPTTKTSIDSVKLKKELPDIASKYVKTSEVKGYVRITLREA